MRTTEIITSNETAASPTNPSTTPSGVLRTDASRGRPTSCTTAHPALRAVPRESPTVRGATASEVHAVAEFVETLTPQVTVRSVSRKGRVYVVRALAAGRVRLYRIPVDMIPCTVAPTPAATQVNTDLDRAA